MTCRLHALLRSCPSCRCVRADRHAARLRRRRRCVLFPQEAPNDPTQARRRPPRARGAVRQAGAVAAVRRRRSSSAPTRTIRSTIAGGSISTIAARCGRALSLRRLTATFTHGPLTVDVGKQFIRWGKADIINPTDRFAPRDFLNVVDTEFLAVTGVRAVGAARRRDVRGGVGAALHAEPHAAARSAMDRGAAGGGGEHSADRRRRGVSRGIADRSALEPRRRRLRVLAVVLRRLQSSAERRAARRRSGRSAAGRAGRR